MSALSSAASKDQPLDQESLPRELHNSLGGAGDAGVARGGVNHSELIDGIIEGAQDGIVTFDTEKRFTAWNPAMERLYGVAAGEVRGRTVQECFPWAVTEGLDAAYDAALRGTTITIAGREITTRANGQTSIVDATYRPLRDARGVIVGGVGVLREVREERSQLQRLRELSAVVEQTREAVVVTDARGRITWANAAWEALTGWSLNEVRGRTPGQVLQGPGSDTTVRAAISHEVRAGLPYAGDILNYRRDGTPFWSSVSITPIRDEHGALHGFVGIKRDVTARRESERRVRAERAFAASLVAANADGVIAVDQELRITEWNPVMEQWSGRSRANAIGLTIDEVVPVADVDRRKRRLLEVLSGEGGFVQERDYDFPQTGVRLVVESVISPITDPDSGEITGLLCTIRDVRERRAANERFRVLFEASSDAHLLVDRTGIIDCNDATLRFLRAEDKEDILSLHPAMLSPEMQPDGVRSLEKSAAMEAIAFRDGRATFDWVHKRFDGSDVRVEVTLTPVTLGGRTAMLVVWHDLTERYAAEEAIRRERTRLVDAINAVDAGFIMFDAEQRLVAVNRAMLRLVPPHVRHFPNGTPLRDLLAAMLVDGRHPVTGEAGDEWLAKAMARHAGDGESFEANYGVTPLQVSLARTSDGGSVAFFTDIGPLKAIQRSLEEARDAARDANRAKSEFLARMSHELRTPLNAIIGFTKQIKKNKAGTQSARDMEFLTRVEANGIRLLELVNDILDLAKVEAGRVDVIEECVAIDALVRDTVATCEGYPRSQSVALRAEIPDALEPVATDPARLRQVLMNLIGNALKFTAKGEVVVRILAERSGRPTAIEVQDTGIGIPANRLHAIFEAFEQASSTTGRDFGGTGLGLSISRALSRRLGGDLEVESAVGRGSIFRVVLPRPTHKQEKSR